MNAKAPEAQSRTTLEASHQQKLEVLVKAHRALQQRHYQEAQGLLMNLIKAIKPEQADRTELRALLLFADAQMGAGDVESAYKNYLVVMEVDPDLESEVLPHIFTCLQRLKSPVNASAFETHIAAYIQEAALENSGIDRLVCQMLKQRFALEDPDANVELVDILSDNFFLLALRHLLLADPYVESFVTQLRTVVFTNLLEHGLSDHLAPITLALAYHSARNEHVMFVSEAEREVLLGIETLFETEATDEQSILGLAHILLAYSLYEPVGSLPVAERIASIDPNRWPELLGGFFTTTIYEPADEARLMDTITTHSITNETTLAVKAQYEHNPYPRWDSIYRTASKLQYLGLYPHLKRLINKPRHFNKKLNCLVAGCGTGRQPIWLASNLDHMDITAIDISRQSLAYGIRMARKLKVQNLQFVCADLLAADQLQRKFDVIECSGVLHHLKEPEAGLAVLVDALRSNGLMHLGLYSRPAREWQGINAARQQITDAELTSDIDSIRGFRKTLLESPEQLLFQKPDFFSTSECRDLLFHVEEHQFDLREIKQLLDRHGLRFLGFSTLLPEYRQAYANRYPTDPDMVNLDNWAEIEEQHPHVFSGMYQFHCQKQPPAPSS